MTIRKVGVTAARTGLTSSQKDALRMYFDILMGQNNSSRSYDRHEIQFHHGKCKGGDRDSLLIAKEFGLWTVAHPSTLKNWTFHDIPSDEERNPKPPLERNHVIVDECSEILAFPCTSIEAIRSGTWATIRYAKKQNKFLIVTYPR